MSSRQRQNYDENNINNNKENNKEFKNYITIPNEMTHYSMVAGKTPWCLKPTYITDEYEN
jgi:hypothetical protein